MYVIDRLKSRLHRDIAGDPQTQGWVLNLYLNGERYPQTVCDYFQSEYAPSEELAAQIRLHERDEHKHELLFGKAIRALGEPVVALPCEDVFNVVIRWFTPGTFHIVPGDDPDVRREKLANFMAHCHFLEKRVARSLVYQAEAGGESASPVVGKVVRAVLRDEARHVAYTLEAVHDLLPRRRRQEVLEAHRRAEARANLRFSHTQMRRFLAHHVRLVPRRRRVLYRICGALMEGAERML